MKRLLVIAGIAALMPVGTGCKSSTEDYYPMSVGSTWNTEEYALYGTTLAALDTMQTSTTLTKVERQVQLSTGEQALEFSSTTTVHQRFPYDTTYTTTSTSYVRETGAAILSYQALNDPTPDTVLALPLTVGKTWHMGDSSIAEAVGQEDVTVKAGSYQNAWKIKVSTTVLGETMDAYCWYANHVGQVKTHLEFSVGGYTTVFHSELVSADIK